MTKPTTKETTMTKPIILQLTVQEVDGIANILAEHPYKLVKGYLDTIVRQANDQVLQSYGPPPPPIPEAGE